MNKTTYGKSLILLAGIIGLFSIFSYFVSFPVGAWWQIEIDPAVGTTSSDYVNAFGQLNDDYTFNPDDMLLGSSGLLAGALFSIGSLLGVVSGINKSKKVSVVAFLLMIVGIGLFLVTLNDVESLNDLRSGLETLTGEEYSIYYGSADLGLGKVTWRLGNGFFIGVFATLLMLVGLSRTE